MLKPCLLESYFETDFRSGSDSGNDESRMKYIVPSQDIHQMFFYNKHMLNLKEVVFVKYLVRVTNIGKGIELLSNHLNGDTTKKIKINI